MPELIATIFHVTDMHLFVDARGDVRKQLPSARLLARVAEKVPVPRVRKLLEGAMWHDEEALLALCDGLPEKSREERDEAPDGTPVLVLQTGDVEALGSAAPADHEGYDAFPSYRFVHERLRDSDDAWEWRDIYGNHDTWPGTYPPMRWRYRAINRTRIATVPGLEGPWPVDADVFQGPAGIPIVVARINTVSRRMLEETLASGTVTDHPPGDACLDDVLEALTAALEPWLDERAVRIVVMHHPPHAFGVTLGQELTTGWLEGGPALARRLSELHVQLVIAGHRHKLNPGGDAMAATPPDEQPPLVAPTVQLVAESPTQDSAVPIGDDTDYDELRPLSFCRYRLWAEGDELAVQRTVFGYTDGRGTFSSETSATVFEELALE